MGPRSWVLDLSRFLGFVFLATKQMRREYVAHLKSTLKRLVLLGCFFAKKKNHNLSPFILQIQGGKSFVSFYFSKGIDYPVLKTHIAEHNSTFLHHAFPLKFKDFASC